VTDFGVAKAEPHPSGRCRQLRRDHAGRRPLWSRRCSSCQRGSWRSI
jgi:hypothetical protein